MVGWDGTGRLWSLISVPWVGKYEMNGWRLAQVEKNLYLARYAMSHWHLLLPRYSLLDLSGAKDNTFRKHPLGITKKATPPPQSTPLSLHFIISALVPSQLKHKKKAKD